MPATAVGRANGSSINPSIKRFPGNSYLTSVHAIITPNILLIIAATSEHPILVTNAFLTLSLVIVSINSAGDSFNEYTRTDTSGISTITDNIVITMPIFSPNPGITLVLFVYFIKIRSFVKIILIGLVPSTKIFNPA